MMIATTTYKQTGIPWMPEVPEHWQVRRLKNVAIKIQTGSTPKTENQEIHFEHGNINWFTPGDIKDLFISTSNRKVTQQAIDDKEVVIFDAKSILVIGIGATLGKVTMITETGGSNQQINAITFNDDVVPEFGLYFLSSFELVLKSISNASTLAILTQSDLKDMLIIVPPKEEQAEIVQHIKAQSDKINRFIQKKQRFIELLKEQRQSIINDKLQINANKKRLKFCVTKVGSGVTPRGGAEVYQDEGVIFLRSQNIHNDGLRLDNVSYISEEINSEMKGSEVQFNDVLINVTGASIGRCFVFDKKEAANVNQHVCIMRPIQEIINSEFLMMQIQSEKIQTIINMVEGASREGLTNHDIKNFTLFVPPIEEQQQIVEHIKTETKTIDTAIAKAEREIELIKEYKEAMIAEAVMGK